MPFSISFLAELRARVSLVDCARQTTKLRRQGNRFVGRCPFHEERTPSFSIDADKGVFYCFGCKVGGDLFAFVGQCHGLDFKGAVRQLAEQTGLPIEGDSPAERAEATERKVLGEALDKLQRIFLWQFGSKEGEGARAYLRQRHIAPATARAFGVGFGGLTTELPARLARAKLTPELLERAGVRAPSSRHPTLFDERLTLPVGELSGRLVGFGGRLLTAAGDRSGAKYLNSCDSLLFHKHRQLFGMAQAAAACRATRRVIVCEGYLDVLALWQSGQQGCVAALGTQLTEAHAERLAKLAPEVVLVFDGDAAGIAAARRAAGPLKQAGLSLSLVALPAGEDPASMLVKAGGDHVSGLIAKRTSALDYFVEQAFAKAGEAIQARVAAAAELAPLLAALPQPLERELYTARVAERLGVAPERLATEWQAHREADRRAVQKAARRTASANRDSGEGAPHGGRGRQASAAPPQRVAATSSAHAAARPAKAPPTAQETDSQQARAEQAWQRAQAHRIAEQELDMVRELLLYPSLYGELAPLVEYFATPELACLLRTLTDRKDLQGDGRSADFLQQILPQCVTSPRLLVRLQSVAPLTGQALDEAGVRANRTLTDILRRLKRRQVDWTLRSVLRELGEAEGRGEATDALLRRKQLLTARKRALT